MMEKHQKKNMEHEVETGLSYWFIGFGVSKLSRGPFLGGSPYRGIRVMGSRSRSLIYRNRRVSKHHATTTTTTTTTAKTPHNLC